MGDHLHNSHSHILEEVLKLLGMTLKHFQILTDFRRRRAVFECKEEASQGRIRLKEKKISIKWIKGQIKNVLICERKVEN